MSDAFTQGSRCGLCGSYFIGSHVCTAPRSVDHGPFVSFHPSDETKTLLVILEELRAIRALLERRAP